MYPSNDAGGTRVSCIRTSARSFFIPVQPWRDNCDEETIKVSKAHNLSDRLLASNEFEETPIENRSTEPHKSSQFYLNVKVNLPNVGRIKPKALLRQGHWEQVSFSSEAADRAMPERRRPYLEELEKVVSRRDRSQSKRGRVQGGRLGPAYNWPIARLDDCRGRDSSSCER